MGEGKFGAMGVRGFGDAPGDRPLIGDAHDEAAFAGHERGEAGCHYAKVFNVNSRLPTAGLKRRTDQALRRRKRRRGRRRNPEEHKRCLIGWPKPRQCSLPSGVVTLRSPPFIGPHLRACSRVRSCGTNVLRQGVDGFLDGAQHPPRGVELIEERQDQPQNILVAGEVPPQLADQRDPGLVDAVEDVARGGQFAGGPSAARSSRSARSARCGECAGFRQTSPLLRRRCERDRDASPPSPRPGG